MNKEIKENIKKKNNADPKSSGRSLLLTCLVLPLSAFLFFITCSGGFKSGIRGVLLGTSILLGLFIVKRFYKDAFSWKKRVGYSILAGAIFGLFAALIIWLIEMRTGSPTLASNPYTQNTTNLFFMCPLYGLFMMGGFALAFKLPWILRFLVIWAGVALVSTLGFEELSRSPELSDYILGVFKGVIIYYPSGLVNCFAFVFLWICCAGVIVISNVEQIIEHRKIINLSLFFILGVLVLIGYKNFYYSFVTNSIDIADERFFVRHKNTVFSEKMIGIIVLPKKHEYYDCVEKKFYKLPLDIKVNNNFEFNSNNKNLKVKARINDNCLEIDKFKNGKLIKKIIHKNRWYAFIVVVNDSVYYKMSEAVFRLKAPDYNKAEFVMKNIPYNYSISPDEKFITYYGGIKHLSDVLCIMNLKDGKVLTLKVTKKFPKENYWVKNMEEFKRHWQLKKRSVKKHASGDNLFGE